MPRPGAQVAVSDAIEQRSIVEVARWTFALLGRFSRGKYCHASMRYGFHCSRHRPKRRPGRDTALDTFRPGAGTGRSLAALAAQLHAVTYELLVLLREFDDCTGWNGGFASCAHWLHWRTGIALGAAREKVRVAHALAALPLVSATMARGAISYAKVRALTRVATPENEAALLDFAQAGTAAHVERLVGAWRRVDHVAAAQAEARHLHRQLSTWVDDDGMVVIRGRLTPEVGAVVQRALEAAADRLFREAQGGAEGRQPGGGGDAGATPGRCPRPAGRGGADGGPGPRLRRRPLSSGAARGGPTVWRQGKVCLAAWKVGSTARWTSPRRRRDAMSCDASVVAMRHGADGAVLDVGRKTRTVPPSIRRALQARDQGCRFPGCTARRCDAHHVEHWMDGGATSLDNLVLLCRRHHRAVHEGGFDDSRGDGSVMFLRPDGAVLETAPPLPVVSPVLRTNARAEELPVWDGARFDVAYAIDVLYQPPGVCVESSHRAPSWSDGPGWRVRPAAGT